jgi:hypothetical protein
MDKNKLLTDYAGCVNLLTGKVKNIPDEILDFRPGIEDAWTIKEHVIHIVDSDINSFIRLKSIIAQPHSTCYVIDENIWTTNLRRKNEDMNKYLSLLKIIRELAYDLLIDEDEANWDKDCYIWNYNNETREITIEKYLELYTKHISTHMDFIDRNISEYNKQSR